MHDQANSVRIEGVQSEVSPTMMDSAYHTNGITATDGVTSSFALHVNDATAFHTIVNGTTISTSNKGYIIIRDPEIGQTVTSRLLNIKQSPLMVRSSQSPQVVVDKQEPLLLSTHPTVLLSATTLTVFL